MSSLFFAAADVMKNPRAPSLDAIGKALSFAPTTRATVIDESHQKVVVTRIDDPTLWAPAHDPVSGTRILLGGRVAFDEIDWKRAGSLPYQGGLACRLLLDAWLTQRSRCPQIFNGAFGIVILEDGGRTVHIFTDRMGLYPIYRTNSGPLAFCTHVDYLADVMAGLGSPPTLDRTSLAEMISYSTVIAPRTYYNEIEELAPSSHHTWSHEPSGVRYRSQDYWRPAFLEHDVSTDWEEMAEEFADAIRLATRRRTHEMIGKPMVLLSAGADSRCALFGARVPSEVDCVTLYDVENPEVDGARKLAHAAGARHHILQRDMEYYGKNAPEICRISSGMFSIDSGHYVGFASELQRMAPGVTLTGCMADLMFKGLGVNRTNRMLAGKEIPVFKPAPYRHQWYQVHDPLSAPWQQKITDRLDARFTQSMRGNHQHAQLAAEDARIRPLSREPDFSGRAFLWRAMPWDHIFSDSDVLRVYGRLSVPMKISGILFGKAVGKVIGPRGIAIPNNNYATPVNASEAGRVAQFLKGVARRKYDRWRGTTAATLPPHATLGGWPEYGYVVANSVEYARLWDNTDPARRAFLGEICGFDPWSRPQKDWANNPILFLRILTASLWLRQRGLT